MLTELLSQQATLCSLWMSTLSQFNLVLALTPSNEHRYQRFCAHSHKTVPSQVPTAGLAYLGFHWFACRMEPATPVPVDDFLEWFRELRETLFGDWVAIKDGDAFSEETHRVSSGRVSTPVLMAFGVSLSPGMLMSSPACIVPVLFLYFSCLTSLQAKFLWRCH